MIVAQGETVHIVYRALYEQSTGRHFLGQVAEVEGALCRIVGYAYIFDTSETFARRPERRATIVDLAESGFLSHKATRFGCCA